MRVKEALTAALHLLVVLCWFSLAAFFVLLVFRPDWRLIGMDWLADRPVQFYWVGAGFALVGIFFVGAFYLLGRGKVARISMGAPGVSFDRKILNCIVNEFFASRFPHLTLKTDVSLLPHNELEFAMEFPSMEERRRDELLRSIEQQLTLFLRERFGYNQSFILCLKSK
jgi:hypothetical protein